MHVFVYECVCPCMNVEARDPRRISSISLHLWKSSVEKHKHSLPSYMLPVSSHVL